MQGEKGMEQKLGSSEVVVWILGIEGDDTNTQTRYQPNETHIIKSTSPQASTKIPVETAIEECFPTIQTNSNTKKANVRTTSKMEEVPKDPHGEKTDDHEDDDEDEIDDGRVYFNEDSKPKQKKDDKWEILCILEFTQSLCIMAVFASSLAVRNLGKVRFWGLEIWRWCVLELVTFCGRLLTGGFTNVLVFLIN